jgi:CelD/BcsL family acetyltransferase involved in cellulose biosynthesis
MEARKLTPTPGVLEVTDRTAFMALAPEWNTLVSSTADEPFFRHEFFRVWVDNFAPEARLRVLTLRDGEGRLGAALPLMAGRTLLLGMPVRQLSATANPHSCRFELLAREPRVAAEAFLAHLRRDDSWDVLQLTDVPEGGGGWSLYEAARAAGLPCGTWESLCSPYVPLPASWEAYQRTLASRFKANCRRRRRKLEAWGRVELERVEGGLELEARLEEGFALEASGWKGRQGTAMSQDGRTRGFYSELAREAGYAGRLALYFLRLDGRAVAFQYGLRHGGRYFLLKLGYDESLGECSPGQLLMEEVLRDCLARGLREFDFLGPDMVWKRDWTDRVRRHIWLYIFKDSAFGRALCAAKFRWGPMAREVVTRWIR